MKLLFLLVPFLVAVAGQHYKPLQREGKSRPEPKGYSHKTQCPNDWGEDGAVFHLHDRNFNTPLVYTYGPKAPGFNPVDTHQPQKQGNAILSWARSDPKDPETHCFPNGTWSELNLLKQRYAWGEGAQSGGITFMLARMNKYAGTLRDFHWHTNSHEIFIVFEGTARVTVCGTAGKAPHSLRSMYHRTCETFTVRPGDIWIAPLGFGHYLEQPHGNETPVVGLAIYSNTHTDAIDMRPIVANLDINALAHDLDLDPQLVASFYPNHIPVSTVFDAAGPDYEYFPSSNTCGDKHQRPCKYLKRGVTNLDNPNTYTQTNNEAKHLLTSIRSALAYPDLGVEWTSRYDMDFPLSIIYTEVKPHGSTDMYWTDNADEVYYVMVPDRKEEVNTGLYATRVDGTPGKAGDSETRKLHPGDLFMCRQGNVCYIHNKGRTTAKLLRWFTSDTPTLSLLKLNMQGMAQSVLASVLGVERSTLDGFSARGYMQS